jgi:hypothetical protein
MNVFFNILYKGVGTPTFILVCSVLGIAAHIRSQGSRIHNGISRLVIGYAGQIPAKQRAYLLLMMEEISREQLSLVTAEGHELSSEFFFWFVIGTIEQYFLLLSFASYVTLH